LCVFCCGSHCRFVRLTTGRCIEFNSTFRPGIGLLTLIASVVRSSNGGGLIFWCLIGICAGIYLFTHGFILLQRRRLILDTPFSKIRSASMGMVELSGLAVGPYTMMAPITSMPCYYYRTLVWEWKQHGKNKAWVKVAGECLHLPFFLDDDTGRVPVDPRGAELDIHRDFQAEFCDSFFTTKDPAPGNVHSFLARHGIVTNNKIKVEEFCIKPKNALFILGTLAENSGLEITSKPIREEVDLTFKRTWSLKMGEGFSFSTLATVGEQIEDPAFAMRLAAPTDTRDRDMSVPDAPKPHIVQLSVSTSPTRAADMTQQQKIAAALLRAGISNPAAWAVAGLNSGPGQVSADPSFVNQSASSSSPSASTTTETGGFDPRPPVVLMKGTNNKTFLISWHSQQDVARSLRWKCAMMIWGGPAIALLSLYVLLNIDRLL
jgi:hypothetical protein